MLQARNILSFVSNNIRLAKEHRNRPSPLIQIHNAYNIKIDTAEYMNNRNYFSTLYRSMRMADIQHQDILSIYGNPYIGIVTKWGVLSAQRKQNILKDYPETESIAGYFREAKRELALENHDFLKDLVIFGVSAVAEWYVGRRNPTVHTYAMTAMANSGARIAARISPKLAKIDYKLNKLYKKAEDFFKKKLNTEAKPRIGASGFKEGQYWSGLTDNVKGLQNLGVRPKKTSEILGTLKKLNKYEHGEIRVDRFGNFYKFDPAHKSSKIHLEKIEKKSDGFWNTAEVDPETGEILKTLKRWIGK